MANLSNINNKFLVTTGGNVLVGQTSVVGSSIFQVTGDSTFTGNITVGDGHFIGDDTFDNLLLQAGGTGNLENLVLSASNDLIFYTGGTTPSALGTERLRIYNSDGRAEFAGNVAINTFASITNDAGIAGISIRAKSDNICYIDFGDSADSNIGGINYSNINDTLNFRTGNTNKVTIDSSGNVGIGTSSPYKKLEVAGDLQLDASNANMWIKSGVAGTNGFINWTFNTNDTVYNKIGIDYDTRASTGFHIDTGYPLTLDCTNYIDFKRSGGVLGRWNSTGLGIGTTSPNA